MKRTNSGKKVKKSNNKNQKKDVEESLNGLNFVEEFQKRRLETAADVIDFNFKKKRVRVLSNVAEIKDNAKGIVYWMLRDVRVQDNWALLYGQKLALKVGLPLHVCYCLFPNCVEPTIRHLKFLLKGLQEIEFDCQALNINFHLLLGYADERIPEFVDNYEIGAVVCDFSPLRAPTEWIENIITKLPNDVTICQVDAHNIVPVWEVTDKQEYSARTIRNKINSKLDVFLTEFPPVIRHPYSLEISAQKVDWDAAFNSLKIDISVDEVDWIKPGYRAACKELQHFCENRLKLYSSKRNDPTQNVLSNLSPWFHFGQISVQRCILTVKWYKSKYPQSVAVFCEEAIIRRELSDNFCFYNKNYDNLTGIPNWAFKTLNDHRKDKRTYIYTKNELEIGHTHDDLWNSAQMQLVKEGKMHGLLRMYWAKKILEWTESPEQALEIAIYLNDKYSLDGRDPNGYVGCMWSIGGVHDQGWKERPIFGKIRYMNYEGCKRKFRINSFIVKYGGKIYNKN